MSYGQPYGYGPPLGQYPPPQNQQWGPPPPQHPHSPYPPPQHGHSPQPPYSGGPYPPPQQQPYPPQGPPPGQYGAPYGQGPPPGQYGHQQPYGGPPPPQQGYGTPPYGGGGQYGAPPPQQPYVQGAPPSLGYVPGQVAPVDTSADAHGCRAAMKGAGTDEKQLIHILTRIPDPLVMAALRRQYHQQFGRDLALDVRNETSGYFCEGLEALIRGPLEQDVHLLGDNQANTSSDYHAFDDVLLGRSNADIHAIKQEYQRQQRRALTDHVNSVFSGKHQQLFDMVLSATRNEESAPVIPQEVERAADDLQRSLHHSKDQTLVCQIFAKHSDGQLRAIAQAYNSRNKKPLSHAVAKECSGHLEDSLLRMLALAEDRAKADADDLEATMKGAGTKDRLMINRIVRLHWNRQHWQQVRAAYRHFYKKDLAERVHKETSGDYRKLATALCENDGPMGAPTQPGSSWR